jgi:hypothetical protein
MFTHTTEKQNGTTAKEELYYMHSIHHYGDEIRCSRLEANVTYAELENLLYIMLLRKPEGKQLLGKSRHRWTLN